METKRLNIRVTDEFRKEIKLRALYRNMPLSTWVRRAILKEMKREDKFLNEVSGENIGEETSQ